MTSISDAVERNSVRVVKLLLAVPGSVSVKEINRGLLSAVKSGYTECVRMLLEAGANPNVVDSCCNCALKIAIESNYLDIVSDLVQFKCNVNYANNSGSKPIHVAARLGRSDAVTLLLSAGVNPDSVDSAGYTPLMYAAKGSHVALMKVLVEANCSVNKSNKDGDTALHLAAQRAVGVDFLLTNGADPNLQDCAGNTALIIAATEGYCTALKKLAKFSDVNVENDRKRCAIHYLAMKGHGECVKELLLAGADPDKPDGDDHTPLWHAIDRNRVNVVKMLLHTNCGLVSQQGDTTPLHLALERKEVAIAKMLIVAGCDAKCLNGWLQGENIPEEIKDDKELWEWIQHISSNPFSLRHLARRKIRVLLGHDVVFKLQNLSLPPALKLFISLAELEECDNSEETE